MRHDADGSRGVDGVVHPRLGAAARRRWRCAAHPFSGYRCLAYNRKCGGAKNSQHMLGTAADVRCERPHEVTYAAAKRIQTRRGRGGVGKYDRFTHVDNRKGKASWQG
jgi:uncharacterized protein YcbK (DUF882 family)